MTKRKVIAGLIMLGIIALGVAHSMNETPTHIPQPVKTDMTFPLGDKN